MIKANQHLYWVSGRKPAAKLPVFFCAPLFWRNNYELSSFLPLSSRTTAIAAPPSARPSIITYTAL